MEEVTEEREAQVAAFFRASKSQKGLLMIATDEESCSSTSSAKRKDSSRDDGPRTEDSQTVHYGDGSAYVGQTIDGQRHGEGIYKCGTEQYEGQWLYDKQHGTGRQTWSDGRSYQGQYDGGRFSGQGQMVWQTQKGVMVYEGEYTDDMKHGNGKFSWPDGRIYDGQWHRGKRHGRGAYRTARGEQKVGHWTNYRFLRWETPLLEEDNVNILLQ